MWQIGVYLKKILIYNIKYYLGTWEFGIGRCKLLHLECINNKVLLYNTGNYIQPPGINHNGKEY